MLDAWRRQIARLPAHLRHALLDDGAVAVHVLRAAVERIGEDSGEAGGLITAEIAGRCSVVIIARGVGAVNAGAPLDEVEIELEDAALAEDEFGDGDQGEFGTFAKDGAAGSEEKVFDKLLSKGGGSADAVATFHVCVGVDADLVPVEAVVLVEAGVFSGDDGVLEVGRDLAERDEAVAGVVGTMVDPGLEAALNVDGGGGRIDEAGGEERECGE